VLTHAGRIGAEAAREHARAELARWRAGRKALPEPVDVDFARAIRETKQVAKLRPRAGREDEP